VIARPRAPTVLATSLPMGQQCKIYVKVRDVLNWTDLAHGEDTPPLPPVAEC
jgi:hypothetical protein